MARRRKEIGVRWKRGKPQLFARVNGKFRSAMAAADSTPGERAAARERLIEEWGGNAEPLAPDSFAAAVARYLAKPEVAAMPSRDDYERMLGLWLHELGGDRALASITRDDIEAVLQRWLKTYKPATVYHRRTALRSMFVAINGADGRNPVNGTTCPAHCNEDDRSIPFATAAKIIAAMADWRYLRKGIRVPALAKLRAAVVLATGIPPCELGKLKPRDVEYVDAFVRMPWRDKGAGTPAHTRELSTAGVAALRALAAANGFGEFPVEALGHSFKRAARRVCGQDTPYSTYWLRHGFGTDTYRVTRDLATVARLMGHVKGSSVTSRYTVGAHADVDRAGLAALEASRAAATTLPDSAPKLPAKLPGRRKRGKQKGLRRVS